VAVSRHESASTDGAFLGNGDFVSLDRKREKSVCVSRVSGACFVPSGHPQLFEHVSICPLRSVSSSKLESGSTFDFMKWNQNITAYSMFQ
jgi:hypothetical protein